MAQFARPSDDITTGIWSPAAGGTLFGELDETTRVDEDYIASSANQLGACEVALSAVNTPGAGTRTLRYTYLRTVTNKNYTLVVRLLENGTLVQSFTHANPASTFTLAEQTITGTISDYSALSVQFEVTVAAGGGGAMQVSWCEFEVPDGAGTAYVRVANNTEQTSEALVRKAALTRVVSETAQVSEGVVTSRALVRVVDDTVQSSETTAQSRTLVRRVAETEQSSESLTKISGFSKVLGDTTQVSESVSKLAASATFYTKLARVAAPQSTGNQDITFSGTTSTPAGVLLVLVAASVDETEAVDSAMSIGFVGGGSQVNSMSFSHDNLATTDTYRRDSSGNAVTLYSGTSTVVANASATLGAGKVTLNWTTAPESGWYVTAIGFFGDVEIDCGWSSITGTTNINPHGGTGNASDVVLISSCRTTPQNSTNANGALTFGFWEKAGDTQGGMNWSDRDANADVQVTAKVNNATIYSNVFGGSNFAEVAVDTHADGFTATLVSGSSASFNWMSLRFTSTTKPSTYVGSFLSTDAGGTQSITAPGFQPNTLILAGGYVSGFNTVDATTDADTFGVGFMVGDAYYASSIRTADASDPSVCRSLASSTYTISMANSAGLELQGVGAFTASGFDVEWASFDEKARGQVYLVIEELNVPAGGNALTRVVSETVQSSEVRLSPLALRRLLNESEQISDARLSTLTLVRLLNETEQTPESVSRLAALTRSAADSVSITETAAWVRGLVRLLAETTSIAEALQSTRGLIRLADETAQVPESVSRLGAMVRQLIETEQSSESVSRLGTLSRVLDETLQAAETDLNPLSLARILDDDEQVAEAVQRLIALYRIDSDDEQITETLLRLLALGITRQVADSEEVSEAVQRLLGRVQALDDTVSIVETISRNLGLVRSVDEDEQTSEVVNRAQSLRRVINDSVTADETPTRLEALTRLHNATVQLSEALEKLVTYQGSGLTAVDDDTVETQEAVLASIALRRILDEVAEIQEGLVATMELRRQIQEQVAVSETLLRAAQWVRTASETVGLSESLVRLGTQLRAVQDAEQVSEQVSRVLTLASLVRVVDGGEEIAETLVRRASLTRTVAEAEQLAETVSWAAQWVRLAADTVGTLETVQASLGMRRSLIETEEVVEGVLRLISQGLARVRTETVEVGDSVLVRRTTTHTADEVAQIAESLVRLSARVHPVDELLALGETLVATRELRRSVDTDIGLIETVPYSRTLVRSLDEVIEAAEQVLQVLGFVAITPLDTVELGENLLALTRLIGRIAIPDLVQIGGNVIVRLVLPSRQTEFPLPAGDLRVRMYKEAQDGFESDSPFIV